MRICAFEVVIGIMVCTPVLDAEAPVFEGIVMSDVSVSAWLEVMEVVSGVGPRAE